MAGYEIFSHHHHHGDAKPEAPSGKDYTRFLEGANPSTALYLGDNIDDALAAREGQRPVHAIIAAGEHGYRQRARRSGSPALAHFYRE